MMVRKTITMVLAAGLFVAPAGAAEQVQARVAVTNPPVCWKPGQGRGVGTLPKACAAGNEISGGLCYPVCPANMVGEGPVCWSVCPPGSTDIGLFCRVGARLERKKSTGRGIGKLPSCASGLEKDAGLCYAPCSAGQTGVGPVCWPACAGTYGTNCGALCATSAEACATTIGQMVGQGLLVTVEAIITQQINPKALADLARTFAWPICR